MDKSSLDDEAENYVPAAPYRGGWCGGTNQWVVDFDRLVWNDKLYNTKWMSEELNNRNQIAYFPFWYCSGGVNTVYLSL